MPTYRDLSVSLVATFGEREFRYPNRQAFLSSLTDEFNLAGVGAPGTRVAAFLFITSDFLQLQFYGVSVALLY